MDYLGYVPALWTLGVSLSITAAVSYFQGVAYYTAL